jgi:starch synthase
MRAAKSGLPPETSLRPTVRPVSKVWMFSHECAGLAQAGGLGEAVAGLSKTLALDSKLDISVFLPSHGRHLDPAIREMYALQDLTTFIAQGHRRGVNGSLYNYLAGIEQGSRNGVNYFLAKGLDPATSRWLDDPIIYDHETTFEKMSLLARTLATYTEYLFSMDRTYELPDLIHAHDWHMVPTGVLVKQRLRERGVNVPLVFTVHLLSGVTLPWHYASEDWCGIRDVQHSVRMGARRVSTLKYSQLWEGTCHNSLERFGCYEADYVTSVSHSYLTRDVRNYVGDAIKGKSDHIYNGCDWDPASIESSIVTGDFKEINQSFVGGTPRRWDLRKYLLTNAISQIERGAEIEDAARPQMVSQNGEDETVKAFQKDGPLVLMTGRLSPQKGADLLLDAVPLVTKTVPTTKFLLFLLSSGDRGQVNLIEEKASRYPDNVRIIYGKQPLIYLMSHIAADVYVMPSRSEPFGISALEAMVTGNPVVGSDIGGIRETVVDIKSRGDKGTGILFPVGDIGALAESLTSLLLLMMADEWTQRGEDGSGVLAERMPVDLLGKMVTGNSRVGSRIRENCRSRVEEKFRWKNAGQMALECYTAARSLAAKARRRLNQRAKGQ